MPRYAFLDDRLILGSRRIGGAAMCGFRHNVLLTRLSQRAAVMDRMRARPLAQMVMRCRPLESRRAFLADARRTADIARSIKDQSAVVCFWTAPHFWQRAQTPYLVMLFTLLRQVEGRITSAGVSHTRVMGLARIAEIMARVVQRFGGEAACRAMACAES